MKRKKQHGGPRLGAGRPKLPPERKAKLIGVRLYPDELERLREVGGINASDSLRVILSQRGIIRRNSLPVNA